MNRECVHRRWKEFHLAALSAARTPAVLPAINCSVRPVRHPVWATGNASGLAEGPISRSGCGWKSVIEALFSR
jgi:hypothetical protein